MEHPLTRSPWQTFFTPRWIITTILVVIVAGVMIRLGFWQLDRLRQRREANARIEAQINAAPLLLNESASAAQLTGMEYRPVVARGVYDIKDEILLRNQVSNDQPGYHLLTPLHLTGSAQNILVDRGFIPLNEASAADRAKYRQSGEQEISGIIRLPHVPRYFGVPDPTLAPGETRLDAWNALNMDRIQKQVPYPLLPVYIQAAPVQSGAAVNQPVAVVDQPDLSEGPHFGYAMQWFGFTVVLLFGYPFFIRKYLK
jgi:surfeit locus 1 family protein